MVKIQVLGNGLIPRMGMLAPITEPFPVGRMTAATILQTSPNLTVNYLNPNDGKFHALTNQNITRVFDEFEDSVDEVEAPAEAPVMNETPAEVNAPTPSTEPEVNDAPIESDKSEMVSENTKSDETRENTEDVEENDDLSPVEGRNSKKKNKRY